MLAYSLDGSRCACHQSRSIRGRESTHRPVKNIEKVLHLLCGMTDYILFGIIHPA